MSLKDDLESAKGEEDVKDAYIKALGLKKYSKGLIDLRTENIWFEAKRDLVSSVEMFSQLLVYVGVEKRKGRHLPPFLGVISREKAALMETKNALPVFQDQKIEWPKKGSKIDKAFIEKVASYIVTHFVEYKIQSHEKEFIHAYKTAIRERRFIRTLITPDNLRQVFDKWVDMIGCELEGVKEVDYALLFFADIMHDGTTAVMSNLPARLLHDGTRPLFALNGKNHELASEKGYRSFWSIYHRPPEEEHRNYLLERRDSLLPLDERSFKGAFYTPLKVVDKAYDLLSETLGKNWQKNYIVWDMCCGVGNLEVKHSNHRNIFMSTLDQADIDVMKASRTCVAATKFQYDYLNDDINDFGQIDYGLTNKVPQELQQAIVDAKAQKKGAKKILVLINPPYAEATNAGNTVQGAESSSKEGVARTRFAPFAKEKYGKASNELFMQFVARIKLEIPTATLAMFSKLKYVTAPNFEKFRKAWQAKYLGGFVIHSKIFEGLKGDFPIGFLVWDTGKKEFIKTVITTTYDSRLSVLAEKSFYSLPNERHLNLWIKRPKANKVTVVPLSNAISVRKTLPRISTWSDNAIAYMCCAGNDIYNALSLTFVCSSAIGRGDGFYITPQNLWQAAIVFSVRRLIKPTWLNDRDQFLQPSSELTSEFKHDCLVWMLFNGSNLTASADGLEWRDQKWSIVNHFIPFTENEAGANARFRSNFMSEYLKGKKLSLQAQAVLSEGLKIWNTYFQIQFERKIRDEFKLNCPDVGWYQIRKALEAHSENHVADFADFKKAYEALTLKLRPLVYELGFLKE